VSAIRQPGPINDNTTLLDTDYLLQAMRREINPEIPPIRPISFRLSVLLKMVDVMGTLLGRKAAMIDKLFLGDILQWLAVGYRMSLDAGGGTPGEGIDSA
jgi:hypothetical protein